MTRLSLAPGPSLPSALTPDCVAREARAELQQRSGPGAHRCHPDRRPPVERHSRLAQRPAERFVVGMPPGVADRRGLPYAELDIDALVELELRMRPPET